MRTYIKKGTFVEPDDIEKFLTEEDIRQDLMWRIEHINDFREAFYDNEEKWYDIVEEDEGVYTSTLKDDLSIYDLMEIIEINSSMPYHRFYVDLDNDYPRLEHKTYFDNEYNQYIADLKGFKLKEPIEIDDSLANKWPSECLKIENKIFLR